MNNQNQWTEREIGMQIGAVIHDAVAISIAHAKTEKVDMVELIKDWVDILFEIGTQKKQAVLDEQLKSEHQDKLGTPYDENYPQVEVASHEVSEPQK